MSKVVGIIGGMGPMATVDLMKKIIENTEAGSDKNHIHMIVDNNTEIPDRSEYILGKGLSPATHLIRTAIALELHGADVLVMPCNTAHYFYEQIAEYTTKHFLHMIDETADYVKQEYGAGKSVCLLATRGTYESGIYNKSFAKYGMNLVIPTKWQQSLIMKLIYQYKSGEPLMDMEHFTLMLEELSAEGAQAFILGCTELPIIFQEQYLSEKFAAIDPTMILAKKVISLCGGSVRLIG